MYNIFIALFVINPLIAIFVGIITGKMMSNHSILFLSSLLTVALVFLVTWSLGINAKDIIGFYVIYICVHIITHFVTLFLVTRAGKG